MNKQLAFQSIEELAPLIEKKEVSPVEVATAIINRAETLDKELNAYIQLNQDSIIKNAQLAEEEIMDDKYLGSLHGIPIGLKDNIYVKNEITTIGSKIHKDFVPDYDATVVKNLRETGAILTGKMNMHEYGYGGTTNNPHHGTCRNPWDMNRIPGGSSGGSAVAIASDIAIATLGSDTAGSVRIPASHCGAVGLKPTYGRVSSHGGFPLAWTLDHIGPITKTVFDSALLLEHIAGYDQNDPVSANKKTQPYSKQLSGNIDQMVIGIEEEYFFKEIDEPIEKSVRQAIKQLEEMGAKVVPISLPSLPYLSFTDWVILGSEALTIHHKNLIERPNDFGDDVLELMAFSEVFSAKDYLQAQQIRQKISTEVSEVFETVDAIISPTTPTFPTLIGGDMGNPSRMTGLANLTGIPAISVPCGLHDGLPIGMQIMGPAFKEENILNLAYAFEKTNPLQGKKPNLESIQL